MTSFSRQNCKNLKKKHRSLENDEFFFGAEFQNNWIKTQKVITNPVFLEGVRYNYNVRYN